MDKRKFSVYVDERGVLHKDAREYVRARFDKEVAAILNISETENETRILGSILNSIIGDMIANKVDEIKKK
jgi:hypothetical protein